MDTLLFPTKGNLIIAKNTLRLSKQGYELLDKKRNILVREMMQLISRATEIQSKIESSFNQAYISLQEANVSMGITSIQQIGFAIDVDNDIDLKFRSVMGVEIPVINYKSKDLTPEFGFLNISAKLDEAHKSFDEVKKLIISLAMIENSVYRLANNIKKTQKRANALKNIMIPRYEKITSDIETALSEKEREEFTRLKVIKKGK